MSSPSRCYFGLRGQAAASSETVPGSVELRCDRQRLTRCPPAPTNAAGKGGKRGLCYWRGTRARGLEGRGAALETQRKAGAVGWNRNHAKIFALSGFQTLQPQRAAGRAGEATGPLLSFSYTWLFTGVTHHQASQEKNASF